MDPMGEEFVGDSEWVQKNDNPLAALLEEDAICESTRVPAVDEEEQSSMAIMREELFKEIREKLPIIPPRVEEEPVPSPSDPRFVEYMTAISEEFLLNHSTVDYSAGITEELKKMDFTELIPDAIAQDKEEGTGKNKGRAEEGTVKNLDQTKFTNKRRQKAEKKKKRGQ